MCKPQDFVTILILFASCLLSVSSCEDKPLDDEIGQDEFLVAQPSGYINLSAQATANSYILTQGGAYCIAVVKGNDSDEWLSKTYSAAVLWETFGTSTAPKVGDLIKSVSYKDGYIAFQTADIFKEGNAVIAAKDAEGNILWSWHIWMTDQPQEHVYKSNAGTMMDRNLGATSSTPGDAGAHGLLYQWGRKDPFLNASFIIENYTTYLPHAKSTISWTSIVPAYPWYGTLDYATSNPTTPISVPYMPGNYDWLYNSSSNLTDNTRWTDSNSPKSIYDPCPAGWRVPDGGLDGIWARAGFNDAVFDDTNKGVSFSIASPSVTWYPASGIRNFRDCSLGYVGVEGNYWSASPCDVSAYALQFNLSHCTSTDDARRAVALSVRCAKE